jgi:polyisoprenoid-binding protein YceI
MFLAKVNRFSRSVPLFLFLALLLVACGGNNEPIELTAIPISTSTTAPEPTTEPMVEPTAEPVQDATAETTVVEPTAEPTATTAPVSAPVTFQIVPAESEVRFSLGEVLAGNPTTVVGRTNELAGELLVDLNDLSTAQLGVIQINAAALATDNNFRNGSIREFILQTDEYPFITFAPTSLTGLPAAAAVGDTITFDIVGDLTIRDVTQSVTFAATVTVVSATQLDGSASTTVNRADFGLEIPSVPNVADVDEEVILEIDFVAATP